MTLITILYLGNILGTVNFNGKHGCQKCLTVGKYNRTARTMSFPIINADRRTDLMFRQRTDPLHHKEYSLLEQLPINMISTFRVSDTLHLLHLGVMKRCLRRWTGKVKNSDKKWNKTKIDKTSRYLLDCNKNMPSDIHRAIRDLDALAHWKGVEFRTILHYVGMVVFRPVLPEDEYEHFLTLCCATTICCCEKYKSFIPMASNMFEKYVKDYIHFYGERSIGSNVHNLIHITEEMIEHDIGNLEHFSTYKYENCLRLLGMKLKSCNRPLEQISRRLIESSIINQQENLIEERPFEPSVKHELPVAQQHNKNNIKKYCEIKIGPGILLSSRKKGDQWFLTRSGEIMKMNHVIKVQNTYKICGFSIIRKGPFFQKPLTSTKLNIYMSDGELNNEATVCDIHAIAAKMICLEYDSNFVYIPILHSLETLSL